MESVKNIILFLYLLAIFMGVAGLTITFLADHRKKTELNKALKFFTIGLVVTNIYDFLLYYTDYTLFNLPAAFAIRLGCAVIAFLACLWVNMVYIIAETNQHKMLKNAVVGFSLAYAVFWLLLALVFANVKFNALRWVLMATDIFFIVLILLASIVFMAKVILDNKHRAVHYLVIVTSLIIWNYIAFAWGETANNLNGQHAMRLPLDMTIIFWFIVNAATILFIFRTSFAEAYGPSEIEPEIADAIVEAGKDNLFDDLQEEYGLTDREKELCQLIYEGKSNSEISEALFITESTVKTHIYNLYRKTGVKNRMEILRVVREFGNDSSE